MNHRRIFGAALGAAAAVCLLVVSTSLRQKHGAISVKFIGFTNKAGVGTCARFEFVNGYARDIGFSAGPVETRGPRGWPEGSNHVYYILTHLDQPYKVGPEGRQLFTVAVTNLESVYWRVPIVYSTVGTRADVLIDSIKTWAGRPVGGMAWSTNTPETFGYTLASSHE